MADFYEIWELRNRLMQDGYYHENEDDADGRIEEQQIARLAVYHYGWKAPEPQNQTPCAAMIRQLEAQTAEDRLSWLWACLTGWDGYSSVRGLGGLIDEALSYLYYPCRMEKEVIKDAEHWGQEIEMHGAEAVIDDYRERINGGEIIRITINGNYLSEIKDAIKKKEYEMEFYEKHHLRSTDAIIVSIGVKEKSNEFI